jgi:Pyruvate/2-oxoacid:ferredoxin oxidoreductase delta subunit
MRIAPHRIGQIIGTALLNAYILAYIQNKVLYAGFLKSVPEPVLNCYGGPLSVFACPLGSFQQIIGMKGVVLWQNIPWVVLGVFIIVGAFVGRAGCGFLCPFGLWQDLLYKIRIGPKARAKGWLSLAVLSGIGFLGIVLLAVFVKVSLWKSILFGWLPLSGLLLFSAIRGKTELPKRWSVAGMLIGIGFGLLVVWKYDVNIGIALGVCALVFFSLINSSNAVKLAAPAGFILTLFGKPVQVGPFAGVELGILFVLLTLTLHLLLDRLLKLSLPSVGIKFAILIIVAGITAYLTAEPWFCKLCPQGTLEAGIPLVLWDPVQGLRALVGWLFYLKVAILMFVLWASIMVKRPFCRVVCPIGAVYALFNKLSFLKMKIDSSACNQCGRCRRVCPTDIEPFLDPNQAECIRCFECVWNCPHRALKITT